MRNGRGPRGTPPVSFVNCRRRPPTTRRPDRHALPFILLLDPPVRTPASLPSTLRAAAHALTAVLLLAACGGGGSSGDAPTQPLPSIDLSAASAVSVVRGQSAATTVTVARGGGFAGDVSVFASLNGNPPGLGVALSTPTVASTATTATLTITTSTGTPLGSYVVTLTGVGAGVLSATATVALTVTAPPGTAAAP